MPNVSSIVIGHRLLLLLASEQPGEVEFRLREKESTLSRVANSIRGTLRLAVQHEGDILGPAMSESARIIRPLHALVEVTISGHDSGEFLAIIPELADQLDGIAEWSQSAVSIGRVHEVLPAASDAVLLTLAATRLPAINRAAFHKYWLDEHAALAMSMLDKHSKSAMGYQQVHADELSSDLATEMTGARRTYFDGVLQCGLARISDLPHNSKPKFADAIAKDEENFADQSAEMLGAFMRPLNAGLVRV